MRTTQTLYWIFTGLFAFMMLGSAIPDVLSKEIAVKGMHDNLGYPLYFIPFIGMAKVLGVIAILVPGFPKIKEWAYAGLFFDLAGATYSIVASGGSAGQWGFMLLPIAFGGLSYLYYYKRQASQTKAKTLVAGTASRA
ncbi:MAG TPA: DoxX family protein [Puia sp.]|nr:DoxX family protein [Puia sp.]